MKKTEPLESIKKKIEWVEKDLKLNKKQKLKRTLIELIAELLMLAGSKNIDPSKIRDNSYNLLEEWWRQHQWKKKTKVGVLKAYEIWAPAYEKTFNPLVLTEDKNIKPLFNELRVKGKKVLDIGCGTGRHALFLAKKGAIVTGLDFSTKMLKVARTKAKKSRLNIKFIKSNLTKKLPFENSAFDLVICSLVFNHIKNIKPIFKEVSRILKHEGIFIFSDLHPGLISEKKYPLFMEERTKVAVFTESFWHSFSEYVNSARNTNFEIEKVLEPKLPWLYRKIAEMKNFRVFDRPLCLIMELKKK